MLGLPRAGRTPTPTEAPEALAEQELSESWGQGAGWTHPSAEELPACSRGGSFREGPDFPEWQGRTHTGWSPGASPDLGAG